MKPSIPPVLAWLLAGVIAVAPVSAQTPAPAAPAAPAAAAFKAEELEQLVAPIALYPDALVAQILMASTYPLEVVEAARWQKANPTLKEKALEDALEKQSWDPSVKSLTAFPQVLQSMNEKLDVTQKLGDAFLAQQKQVLDAVQRLRGRADQAGNLKSSKEQTVSKEQEGGTTVIKIEPANPQTVYVPTYSPAVYGTWPYPSYPPYYYPYPPGAGLFAFTAGVIVGSALWGGCAWGRGDVTINRSTQNNFTRNSSGQGGNWQHNAEHRKGAGYRDQASQQKFGSGQRAGVDSREQFRGRAEQGRQEINRGGADGFKGGGPSAGTSDRAGPGGDRGGDRGGPSAGTSDRAGPGGDRGGDRGGGASAGNMDRGGGDFANRGSGAFQGSDRGGSQTRMTSDRGAASRSSFAGGGGGRTGGAASTMGGGGRGGGGGGGGRGGRR